MNQAELSRRAFLRSSSAAMKASCITLSIPMVLTACSRANETRLNGGDFATLSADEAREYDAIAARIIPTDETPGAHEAGAVYFIDNVIGDAFERQRQTLRSGLADLQDNTAALYDTAFFADLTSVQQDSLLTQIEDTEFFATIRFLVVAAMFSLPEYGGNKDELGWQLIGFEERHVWTQPYGFYDADHLTKGG